MFECWLIVLSLNRCLRYLLHTRPDLSFSVGVLSRYMQNPRVSHGTALKQIMRYLRGTCSLGLHYPCKTCTKMLLYSDSSHNIDIDVLNKTRDNSIVFLWSWIHDCNRGSKTGDLVTRTFECGCRRRKQEGGYHSLTINLRLRCLKILCSMVGVSIYIEDFILYENVSRTSKLRCRSYSEWVKRGHSYQFTWKSKIQGDEGPYWSSRCVWWQVQA